MGCAWAGALRSEAGVWAVTSPLLTDGGWCSVGRLGMWAKNASCSTERAEVRLGGVQGRQVRPSSFTGSARYERTWYMPAGGLTGPWAAVITRGTV